MIETGKLDEDIDIEEYEDVADRLIFNPISVDITLDIPQDIPQENVYGQVDWEKFFGKIDTVSPLPKEAFEPSPLNKDKRMIDDFFFIWVAPKFDDLPLTVDNIEKAAISEKFGENKMKLSCNQLIRANIVVNKSIVKGYWVAMSKIPLDGLRDMTTEQQEKYIEDNFPKEYGLPETREAILYCQMPRARTGAFVLGRGEKEGDQWTLTRCKEPVNGHRVCVGAGALSGLRVDHDNDADSDVCVVLSRRFQS